MKIQIRFWKADNEVIEDKYQSARRLNAREKTAPNFLALCAHFTHYLLVIIQNTNHNEVKSRHGDPYYWKVKLSPRLKV